MLVCFSGESRLCRERLALSRALVHLAFLYLRSVIPAVAMPAPSTQAAQGSLSKVESQALEDFSCMANRSPCLGTKSFPPRTTHRFYPRPDFCGNRCAIQTNRGHLRASDRSARRPDWSSRPRLQRFREFYRRPAGDVILCVLCLGVCRKASTALSGYPIKNVRRGGRKNKPRSMQDSSSVLVRSLVACVPRATCVLQ